MLIPLILGGGGSTPSCGPFSRKNLPKQFLALAGKVALELIEVQSGSYLGEDDIVRYDDVYGRA